MLYKILAVPCKSYIITYKYMFMLFNQQEAIKRKGINLDEIEKPVLGTMEEKQSPSNSSGTAL